MAEQCCGANPKLEAGRWKLDRHFPRQMFSISASSKMPIRGRRDEASAPSSPSTRSWLVPRLMRRLADPRRRTAAPGRTPSGLVSKPSQATASRASGDLREAGETGRIGMRGGPGGGAGGPASGITPSRGTRLAAKVAGMLVLNKEAALDHVITRSLRLSEVVPEPFALHAAAELEGELPPGEQVATPWWRPANLDATVGVHLSNAAGSRLAGYH